MSGRHQIRNVQHAGRVADALKVFSFAFRLAKRSRTSSALRDFSSSGNASKPCLRTAMMLFNASGAFAGADGTTPFPTLSTKPSFDSIALFFPNALPEETILSHGRSKSLCMYHLFRHICCLPAASLEHFATGSSFGPEWASCRPPCRSVLSWSTLAFVAPPF